MPRDVFISHAGDDAGVAVEVCALLEERGLQCWMAPRDVAAGAVWDEAILDAIERSRIFLLILSSNANQSQFVKNEVNRAFSQSKPIVTFRLEEVVPGRSLELYLARHHWTDAFPPPLGARVERLAGSISALLEPSGSASVASAPSTAPPTRRTLASRFSSPLRALAKSAQTVARRPAILGSGALLLGLAVASVATWYLKPSPPVPKPVSRYTITLPPGQQLAGLDNGPAVALSHDGTNLAYVATQNGTQQLYLRAMDSLEARPIADTIGAASPFFSPDGQWIGFFVGGKLEKVSVGGGSVMMLGEEAGAPRGASWGSQGMIVFARGSSSVVQQVSDAGGTPQPLTRLGKEDASHRWPEFLPSSKAIVFVAGSAASSQVAVQSVATGERRNLVRGATQPRYASSGHLIYAQEGKLMAVPFDPQSLAATGAAVPVVEGVAQSTSNGAVQYSLSDTGSLVYVAGGVQSAQWRLVWVDRKGAEQVLPAPVHAYRYPRISPDGRRVAVTIEESEDDIWLYDLARDTLTRLTFQGSFNLGGAWSPDGKRIAFESNKEGPQNIFWQLADGSGGLERLTTSEDTQNPNSWSPDGQLLAFIENTPTTGQDIWMLRMSDRKAQPFLRTPFNESAPRFSPDGRWMAYVSNESGHYEVYVQPYPGPGGKWQISTEGGTEPVWNRSGRELFFRSGDKMMAVDIGTQPSLTVGKPHVLFAGAYVPTPVTFPDYDVSPDGQRFLMLKPVESAAVAPTQINVVLNWFEELKQKVPTGTK